MHNTMYNALLMDHYQNPRHAGAVESPSFCSKQHNPSCGDSIQFQARIEGNTIVHIGFVGVGCIISQATASLLAEQSVGKRIDDIAALEKKDVELLIGIALGPIRLKCALLPLSALQEGIHSFKKNL